MKVFVLFIYVLSKPPPSPARNSVIATAFLLSITAFLASIGSSCLPTLSWWHFADLYRMTDIPTCRVRTAPTGWHSVPPCPVPPHHRRMACSQCRTTASRVRTGCLSPNRPPPESRRPVDRYATLPAARQPQSLLSAGGQEVERRPAAAAAAMASWLGG